MKLELRVDNGVFGDPAVCIHSLPLRPPCASPRADLTPTLTPSPAFVSVIPFPRPASHTTSRLCSLVSTSPRGGTDGGST